MSPILRAEDVAQLLDCSTETINERTAAGDLPGIKFGRSWVYPAEALFERLNTLAREGRSKPAVASPTPLGIVVPKVASAARGRARRTRPELPQLPRVS